MKKFLAGLAVTGVIFGATATSAFAAEGGAPGAHGVDGRTFGKVVSALAKSYPGAVADHVSAK